MNDSERAKVVENARKDVDEFISNLKPQKYKDGWPEDKWEEEMEKHPAFMSKPLEGGQEMPPLVEALQQLKYDPEFSSPIELAKSYKDDGNENFKQKKYRWAVDSYTKALEAKCEDSKLNAVLYSNRAAAEYHLGNYRKSLNDATSAKTLDPENFKALQRGAMCCLELENYDDCTAWCDEGLKLKPEEQILKDLKTKAQEKKKKAKELKELNVKKERKLQRKLFMINKGLKERGIAVEGGSFTKRHLINLDVSDVPLAHSSRVQVTREGVFLWPVLLLYPEHCVSDYIQAFDEDTCFYDHLSEMFASPPEWDTEKKYIQKNLQVYFTSSDDELVRIDKKQPLKQIMQDKRFTVSSGTLVFIVMVKNSEFDRTYRAQSKKA